MIKTLTRECEVKREIRQDTSWLRNSKNRRQANRKQQGFKAIFEVRKLSQ